jgi:hypothetical protein
MSGDRNQGREMTVSVTEIQALDTPSASRHGVVEIMRAAGRESRLAVLPPHAVEDHSGCQQRFRLEPGAQFEWDETVRVAAVVLRPADLEIDIEIVDPIHCDSFSGCGDTMLTANAAIDIR